MTKLAERFGIMLRDARRARGLSQEQLAKIGFITQKQISRIECGHDNPNLLTMERLLAPLMFELVFHFRETGPYHADAPAKNSRRKCVRKATG